MVGFEVKNVLLADSIPNYRVDMRNALEASGHTVLATLSNCREAFDFIARYTGKIEAAVLSDYLPNRGDGSKVAQMIVDRYPKVLIAQVDEATLIWNDPHYDSTRPDPTNVNKLDVNGRSPWGLPAIRLVDCGWDMNIFCQAVGEWRFTLEDPRGMQIIEEAKIQIRSWKSRG